MRVHEQVRSAPGVQHLDGLDTLALLLLCELGQAGDLEAFAACTDSHASLRESVAALQGAHR